MTKDTNSLLSYNIERYVDSVRDKCNLEDVYSRKNSMLHSENVFFCNSISQIFSLSNNEQKNKKDMVPSNMD